VILLQSSIVDSPLGGLLTDPWGAIQTVLNAAWSWMHVWGPIVGPVALTAISALIMRRWWNDRCQDRLHDQARVVTILAPPTVDPDGAEAAWSNLVGLLRPMWTRLVGGQPLAWEYVLHVPFTALRMHALRDDIVDAMALGSYKQRHRDLWGWTSFDSAAAACLLAIARKRAGYEVCNIVAARTASFTPSEELARRWYPDVPQLAPLSGTAGFYSVDAALAVLGWDARDEHPMVSDAERADEACGPTR
jgi:hypothetical protein